jgi:hypothetical protein
VGVSTAVGALCRLFRQAGLTLVCERSDTGLGTCFRIDVAGLHLLTTRKRLAWRSVMDGTPGPGTRGDTRWMTYRELGKARGISAASAARLAYRKEWQRQPGNDGAARVAVPLGEDQPSPYDARGGTGAAATGEAPGHGARGLAPVVPGMRKPRSLRWRSRPCAVS